MDSPRSPATLAEPLAGLSQRREENRLAQEPFPVQQQKQQNLFLRYFQYTSLRRFLVYWRGAQHEAKLP